MKISLIVPLIITYYYMCNRGKLLSPQVQFWQWGTEFVCQKWSGGGTNLAAKSGLGGPILDRTNYRMTDKV